MEIQRKPPTAKAPAERFIGDAWIDVIAAGEDPSRVRVNVVRFGDRENASIDAWGRTSIHRTVGPAPFLVTYGPVRRPVVPAESVH